MGPIKTYFSTASKNDFFIHTTSSCMITTSHTNKSQLSIISLLSDMNDTLPITGHFAREQRVGSRGHGTHAGHPWGREWHGGRRRWCTRPAQGKVEWPAATQPPPLKHNKTEVAFIMKFLKPTYFSCTFSIFTNLTVSSHCLTKV